MKERLLIHNARLHNAITFAGKNFKDTIETSKIPGLHIILERGDYADRLYLLYGGKAALIGVSFSYVELDKDQAAELYGWVGAAKIAGAQASAVTTPAPTHKKGKVNAQVSTPTSHVFNGVGQGQR